MALKHQPIVVKLCLLTAAMFGFGYCISFQSMEALILDVPANDVQTMENWMGFAPAMSKVSGSFEKTLFFPVLNLTTPLPESA